MTDQHRKSADRSFAPITEGYQPRMPTLDERRADAERAAVAAANRPTPPRDGSSILRPHAKA